MIIRPERVRRGVFVTVVVRDRFFRMALTATRRPVYFVTYVFPAP